MNSWTQKSGSRGGYNLHRFRFSLSRKPELGWSAIRHGVSLARPNLEPDRIERRRIHDVGRRGGQEGGRAIRDSAQKYLLFLFSVVIVSTLSCASFQIRLVRLCTFPTLIGSIACGEVPRAREGRSGKSSPVFAKTENVRRKPSDHRRRLTIQDPDFCLSQICQYGPC